MELAELYESPKMEVIFLVDDVVTFDSGPDIGGSGDGGDEPEGW